MLSLHTFDQQSEATDEKQESLNHFNAIDTLITKNIMTLDTQGQDSLIAKLDHLKKQIEESTAFKNIVYNRLNPGNRVNLEYHVILLQDIRRNITESSPFLAQTDSYLNAFKKALDEPEVSLEKISDIANRTQPKLFNNAHKLFVGNKLEVRILYYLFCFEESLDELNNLFAKAIANENNSVKLNPLTSTVVTVTTQQYALNQLFTKSGISNQLLKIVDDYFLVHVPHSKTYKDLMAEKLKNQKNQTKNTELEQGILIYERLIKAHDGSAEQPTSNIKLGELVIKFYSSDRTLFENFRQFITEESLPLTLQINLRSVNIEALLKEYLKKDTLTFHLPTEHKAVLPESLKTLSVKERFVDVTNVYKSLSKRDWLDGELISIHHLSMCLGHFAKWSEGNENLKKLCYLAFLTIVMSDTYKHGTSKTREYQRIFSEIFTFMQTILDKFQNTPAYSCYLQTMYSFLIRYFDNDKSLESYGTELAHLNEIRKAFKDVMPFTDFEDKTIPGKFNTLARPIKIKQAKYYAELDKYMNGLVTREYYSVFDYNNQYYNTPIQTKELVFQKMAANEFFFSALKTNPDITAETLRADIIQYFGPEVLKSRGYFKHFKPNHHDILLKVLSRIQNKKPAAEVTPQQQNTNSAKQKKPPVKSAAQNLKSECSESPQPKYYCSEDSKIEVCEPEDASRYQLFIGSPGCNIASPSSTTYGFKLFDENTSSNKPKLEHNPSAPVAPRKSFQQS